MEINAFIPCFVRGGIVPFVLRQGVFGAFPDEGAMPTAIWIYIGMGEGGGFGYGAYDGKAAKIMEEADYDTECANDIAMELIGDKMSYFRQNPQQAALFYREKVLWQWTDPSFHCFTYTRLTEKGYPVGLAYDIVKGKVRAGIFDFMDAYQSFVYLLSVIGVLGIVRRRETIVNLLWAVILLGGFFFHILWEADSRYIYPYFVLMLPMCAYGVCSMSDAALRIAERMRNYVKIKMKQDV